MFWPRQLRDIPQVILDKEKASEIALEGIQEIVHQVGRWKQIASLSTLIRRKSFEDKIVTLYKNVLSFLVSTTKYLEGKSLSEWHIAAILS